MQKKAYLYIILAASLWGCIGIFLNLLNAAGLTSMQSVAIRTVVATVLYGLWLFFTDRKALRIRPADCIYFVGTGILSLLFFNWCYFNTITTSSLSVAAVLLYTAPAFVMLMSALLFREPVTKFKLLALALTFLGCTLVTGMLPRGEGTISSQTLLYGLGAGFGYALYTIFGKLASAKFSSSTVTFYTFLFASFGALPLSRIWTVSHQLLDWRVILGSFSLAILCCILPYLVYTEALHYVEAGRAAIVSTIEPFVACLLGVVVFHEEFTVFKLLGMACILLAIILLNTGSKVRKN